MASMFRAALRVAPRFAARPAPVFRQPSFGFRAFAETRYMPTHEWFSFDGNEGTLGVSDFAQGALGEVVYCELPEVGATFKAKQTICTLESVKAVGEVYAPVDCEVLAVNEKLSDEPATVNSSPEGDGWLVKLKFTGSTDSLMDVAAYKKHVESESKEEH
mmetsp:Transcript_19275/g.30781  ORF Transcript_19275/g.30781 Transcript_19275/m.30781 type:complete len:160 (-) Transcript_19275:49-528(-)|eukprot:CAMPEP_0115092310 /NCGR_PEP_ID=MMETSP0227-20121206/26683_1 /TAXON_ID=89957 /ORGANISM="Polarella glacialis, Strain CCMP 1383" /LENGTH=159 /DNA_ID=CAMNT_0002484091 /DNA_START=61 /DNA_END=540 /DNA_ORIENTATION=-